MIGKMILFLLPEELESPPFTTLRKGSERVAGRFRDNTFLRWKEQGRYNLS